MWVLCTFMCRYMFQWPILRKGPSRLQSFVIYLPRAFRRLGFRRMWRQVRVDDNIIYYMMYYNTK